MDSARRIMGGIRIVTMQGELFEASGAMVGGNISQQNLLKFGAASEDKLAEIGEKLRNATEALNIVRTKLREVRDEIRQIDDEMRAITASGINARERMAEIQGTIGELERTRKAYATELTALQAKLASAETDLETSRDAFMQVSENLTSLNEKKEDLKQRMDAIAPIELQAKVQAIRDELYKVRTLIVDSEAQKKNAETEIAGYVKQNESTQMQLDAAVGSIAASNMIIENNRTEVDRLKVELDALRIIESDMEAGIEDLRNEKEAHLQAGYALDADVRELTKDIETDGGLLLSYDAQRIAAEESVNTFSEEVAAIQFEVAQPLPSEDEIRRRIRALEKDIASLGNVNMHAIEDYDEKKKRYDTLMDQVNSINLRIGELDDLMETLSSKKKGLFMQSYNAVDANFRAIYAELSGGGEAFMGLENEEDPFSGGLTINAKPRNGKLLRLESLSGGEKSLTALSFIFAIQEYQPSPFYVLDEVDMFLDSVNAEMVAKRVRESSAKAQFIQVSLRAVALKCANNLIGVTRPPTGISRIIIQPDLAEVSKYEEQAIRKMEEAD